MNDAVLTARVTVPGRLHVDLSVGAGCTAIVGASGAGKSTLLHVVAGLLDAPGATVRFGDRTWQDDRTAVPPERRGIGLQFQDSRLFPHLTVRGNLDYPRRHGTGRAAELPDPLDCARALGLDGLLDRPATALSGGETRRVALARALAAARTLLLLDEPLGGLDQGTRERILPWLRRCLAQARVPCLLVTHSLAEAAFLARDVIVLDEGGVVAHGDPMTVLPMRAAVSSLRDEDTENLLPGRVGRDGRSVQVGGVHFSVAAHDLPAGADVILRLAAGDVLIGLSRHGDLSARNMVDGIVAALHPVPDGVLAAVDLGADVVVLVSLTEGAVDALGLKPGRAVVLYVKTTALRLSTAV